MTNDGNDLDAWRVLPQIYAGVLVLTAILFFVLSGSRVGEATQHQTMAERLAPLTNVRVWRFGRVRVSHGSDVCGLVR